MFLVLQEFARYRYRLQNDELMTWMRGTRRDSAHERAHKPRTAARAAVTSRDETRSLHVSREMLRVITCAIAATSAAALRPAAPLLRPRSASTAGRRFRAEGCAMAYSVDEPIDVGQTVPNIEVEVRETPRERVCGLRRGAVWRRRGVIWREMCPPLLTGLASRCARR